MREMWEGKGEDVVLSLTFHPFPHSLDSSAKSGLNLLLLCWQLLLAS